MFDNPQKLTGFLFIHIIYKISQQNAKKNSTCVSTDEKNSLKISTEGSAHSSNYAYTLLTLFILFSLLTLLTLLHCAHYLHFLNSFGGKKTFYAYIWYGFIAFWASEQKTVRSRWRVIPLRLDCYEYYWSICVAENWVVFFWQMSYPIVVSLKTYCLRAVFISFPKKKEWKNVPAYLSPQMRMDDNHLYAWESQYIGHEFSSFVTLSSFSHLPRFILTSSILHPRSK